MKFVCREYQRVALLFSQDSGDEFGLNFWGYRLWLRHKLLVIVPHHNTATIIIITFLTATIVILIDAVLVVLPGRPYFKVRSICGLLDLLGSDPA